MREVKGERKGIKFWTEKLIIGTILAWPKILKKEVNHKLSQGAQLLCFTHCSGAKDGAA